jgi:hypothetical protein
MTPGGTTTYASPKRVETVDGEEDRVKYNGLPFQARRFHIKKNPYNGLWDVDLVITNVGPNNKAVVVEAFVCEHKDISAALACAHGIDCVKGTPVGRLH